MDLTQLHSNLTDVIDNIESIVLDLAMEANPSIVELNQEQMYEGKTSEGNDISPKYSENPYFKTKESAARYAEWKMKITPNKDRNKDVPNLYINGGFYESIISDKTDKEITQKTTSALGRKIISEHKDVLGLNKKSLKIMSQNIKEPLLNNIRDELTKS